MRGKRAKKRPVSPDPVYKSELISKLVNYIMLDGKKELAVNIIYDALNSIDLKDAEKYYTQKAKEVDESKEETKSKATITPVFVLEEAVGNITPKVEIRSRRIGGANYQIPVPVNPERQLSLALRWLINAARDSRKSTPFYQTLGVEIVAAFKNEGAAIKKKEDTHRMADANKAFAQFA